MRTSSIRARSRSTPRYRRAAGSAVAVVLTSFLGLPFAPASAVADPAAAPATPSVQGGAASEPDPGTSGDALEPPMLSEVLNPFAVSTIRDAAPAAFEENLDGLWGAPGDFYDEPPIEDWMAPGHLLKSEPFEVVFSGIKPAHIRSWRIMYVTEDVENRKVISTGIIMLPDDGRYAGMALLNGLRAAYQVPGPDVNPDNPVGLYGVAGGGVGASFAIEYQPWYAPEIPIKATMLEAMAVNQKNFIDFADGQLGSGFVLATLVGLESQYPEMRLSEKLNPAGRALTDLFRDSCQTYWYFGTPFLPQASLYASGLRSADEPDFQRVFHENTLGLNNPDRDPALTPPGKVLVSSCAGDDSFMVVTPASDSRWLVDEYRAQGVDARYQGLDCSMNIFVTDLYKWGTELFGMHTVDWFMSELR
jgi:hypothetical protein